MVVRVSVLGAGAWGTALACAAVRSGRPTMLWGRDALHAQAMQATRVNEPYLPDIMLPDALDVTADLATALRTDMILLAVPAQSTAGFISGIASDIEDSMPLVICSKGFEQETGAFLSDLVQAACPHAEACVLSGPSFAHDVARGLPTAVTIAAEEMERAEALCAAIGSTTFRPYASDDVIGVQVGGALKNVLAIACGICEGKRLGASAKAALIARGFAEMRRLGNALGARKETLFGLSGLGDLVLSTGSAQSRNFAYGVAIGRGETLPAKLAEGRWTVKAALHLAQLHLIDMPICKAVANILDGDTDVEEAMLTLLSRPLRAEEAL
jgi:glycerol-3-phosphate dehydrogenase (NAD(P)+)